MDVRRRYIVRDWDWDEENRKEEEIEIVERNIQWTERMDLLEIVAIFVFLVCILLRLTLMGWKEEQ